MSKETGGPAFPREDYQLNGGMGQEGMSLRDYFAQAVPSDEISDINYRSLSLLAKEHLAGMKSPQRLDKPSGHDVIPFDIELAVFNCRVNAAIRYMMADAMLAERAK